MASTSAAKPLSVTKKSPNWMEMPDELMANILQRLSTVEILKSARRVCTTWQRICKDPAIWKVVVIPIPLAYDANYKTEMLTKQAVDLSCGELIDITIGGLCTGDLLDYVVQRSSKLNRICLRKSSRITGSGFSRSLKRVPQLEELNLGFTSIEAKDIEVIGRNCPQLKSFGMRMIPSAPIMNFDDHAIAIANNMPALRNLKIYGEEMTNDGLLAILNGCRRLQSLEVHMWRRFNLNGSLVKKCMERIKDFKHNSIQIDDGYDIYSVGSDDDEFSEEE